MKWLFNNEPIVSPDYQISSVGDTYTLYIPEVFDEDAGRFTVVAENDSGTATCTAILMVQDEPAPLPKPQPLPDHMKPKVAGPPPAKVFKQEYIEETVTATAASKPAVFQPKTPPAVYKPVSPKVTPKPSPVLQRKVPAPAPAPAPPPQQPMEYTEYEDTTLTVTELRDQFDKAPAVPAPAPKPVSPVKFMPKPAPPKPVQPEPTYEAAWQVPAKVPQYKPVEMTMELPVPPKFIEPLRNIAAAEGTKCTFEGVVDGMQTLIILAYYNYSKWA